MSTSFLADLHVHIHPVHDPDRLFDAAARRLAGADPVVLALTESARCHAFDDLAAGRLRLKRWRAEPVADDPGALRLMPAGAPGAAASLWLVRGRQIITRERLEVLALACEPALADGVELDTALRAIRTAGGLPVLPWSPGKWLGARGARALEAVAAVTAPGELAAGDTALRARGWPEPRLFQVARARGLRVLCGSDPLPLPGEEEAAGRYATRVDGGFDPAAPARSMAAALRDPARSATPAGRRDPLPAMAVRWVRNEWTRRTGGGRRREGTP